MSEGLRERKRRQTHAAIERAALELMVDRGADAVTVDEIAERANVAPRTFFNYFASRDDVVLGRRLTLDPEISVTDGDTLLDLLRLASMRSLEMVSSEADIVLLRRKVLQQAPALFAKRIALSHDFEQQVTGLAIERCRLDGDPDPERTGALVATVAIAVGRFGWMQWVDSGKADGLADSIDRAFGDMEAVIGTYLAK